jgi:hypothetical protein
MSDYKPCLGWRATNFRALDRTIPRTLTHVMIRSWSPPHRRTRTVIALCDGDDDDDDDDDNISGAGY